ncbi:hypothetical protein FPV67DRAFT_1090460 [Lyophyllum atratum]|nr:hypothetical protein FPV67DRAFT_1090460 [Lyophyllum atratum]
MPPGLVQPIATMDHYPRSQSVMQIRPPNPPSRASRILQRVTNFKGRLRLSSRKHSLKDDRDPHGPYPAHTRSLDGPGVKPYMSHPMLSMGNMLVEPFVPGSGDGEDSEQSGSPSGSEFRRSMGGADQGTASASAGGLPPPATRDSRGPSIDGLPRGTEASLGWHNNDSGKHSNSQSTTNPTPTPTPAPAPPTKHRTTPSIVISDAPDPLPLPPPRTHPMQHHLRHYRRMVRDHVRLLVEEGSKPSRMSTLQGRGYPLHASSHAGRPVRACTTRLPRILTYSMAPPRDQSSHRLCRPPSRTRTRTRTRTHRH